MFAEVNLAFTIFISPEMKIANCACGHAPLFGFNKRRNRYQVVCRNSGCRQSWGMKPQGAVDSWNEIQYAAKQDEVIAALKERAK